MNIKELFKYTPPKEYNFSIPPPKFSVHNEVDTNTEINNNIDINLKYIKNKYNIPKNSDVIVREFSLTAKNIRI